MGPLFAYPDIDQKWPPMSRTHHFREAIRFDLDATVSPQRTHSFSYLIASQVCVFVSISALTIAERNTIYDHQYDQYDHQTIRQPYNHWVNHTNINDRAVLKYDGDYQPQSPSRLQPIQQGLKPEKMGWRALHAQISARFSLATLSP